MDMHAQLHEAGSAARYARSLTSEKKSLLISAFADTVEQNTDDILAINKSEVDAVRTSGVDESQLDRLTLTSDRIKAMVASTRSIAALDDPIGEVLDSWTQDSGINIEKIRVPLGVVAVIYENRPNVTLDSAAIALMSGNACVLRGSSTARETNKSIVAAIHAGLETLDAPTGLVTFIDDVSRDGAKELMQSRGLIDVLIPRGGPSLISAVEEFATVPTIIDGAGNCHVYVDRDADLDVAERVVVNSKTQRTSVCNAAESLVVHVSVADEFIPRISKALGKKDVELVGDRRSVDLSDGVIAAANEDDFATEFLGLKMSVAVVDSLTDAIDWVNKHSTGHTESIITDNPENAAAFMSGVTSAVVMHNTSTRFTDGERFGFGAEIGISTQKLHARGPMALRELTTYQYRVSSEGATV
ncbi:MAG TPA: glutamate-5-semialdehyde dehydrogenase [Acidimicrobiia bacterium]|nr:glutamate-5-semialdehyde dehydrogenase [Acidimicrobiia bacterium]